MVRLPAIEKSFWREFYPQALLYSPLTEKITVDVAIVGAGITGMSAAYLLKNAGLTVAVVEKHSVAGGTTGRTTGKVTSQHGLNYYLLQKRFGRQAAKLYGEANQAAIHEIEKIIKKESIECDWHRDDNYVFTTDPDKIKQFKQEARVSKELGLPAKFVTETPLPFEVSGAVTFANQGKIHTQKYLLGLARAVHGDGSYVFEDSTVIGIREGRPGRIKTSRGSVSANHIIVASSVPTFPLMARFGYALQEYPAESYLVAGHPNQSLSGMYISPDKQHYSILPTVIDGKNVLLVGGEGHLWGLRGNRQARFERLAHYAQKHFGPIDITNRWSDRDYIAYDGVPLVGKLYPWSKHLYVGTAFKKWGLANGTAAAMMLRNMICDTPNPWIRIFNAQRPALLNRFRG